MISWATGALRSLGNRVCGPLVRSSGVRIWFCVLDCSLMHPPCYALVYVLKSASLAFEFADIVFAVQSIRGATRTMGKLRDSTAVVPKYADQLCLVLRKQVYQVSCGLGYLKLDLLARL